MTLKSIQIIGQNFEGLKKNFNIINKRNMQMLIFIIRNKTWKFIKKKKKKYFVIVYCHIP